LREHGGHPSYPAFLSILIKTVRPVRGGSPHSSLPRRLSWPHRRHRVVANQRSEAMKRTRRNPGATFKAQVALAAVKGDETRAEWVEQFSVHPTQITDWKQ
jgi:hypothetical protein